jgi:CRISPR type III-A-associated protein Csm2
MEQRQCATCKKQFTPKEARHKICFDCFQKERGGGGQGPAQTAGAGNLPADFEAYLDRLHSPGGGYFDGKGNLRAELRVEDADMVAQMLARATVTTGQLRKFFTMARSLEQRLRANGDFAAIVPEIASLQPFAAAAVGRERDEGRRARLAALRAFIDVNAALARQNEAAFLKGFVPHFESVIAYFTLHNPNRKER